MQWTTTEAGRLYTLAEDGALTPAQLAAAATVAPLEPPREAWLAAADRLLAFAGVLLLAAGAIFFFAYNWEALDRLTRLAIAVGALAACTAAGLLARPFGTAWRAALFGACLTTGALLALVGQIYQTGADVWELFAAWAALMLPFTLLSRSAASWSLWLAVANAGLLRALETSAWLRFVGVLGQPDSLFTVAACNLAVLLVFEALGGRLLAVPRRHVHRLAALGVVAPLAVGAAIGWWDDHYLRLTVVFALTAAAALPIYLGLRRDVPLLATVVFASIAVLTSGLARLLPAELDFWSLNLLGLAVVAGSGAAAVWLTRLYKEDVIA